MDTNVETKRSQGESGVKLFFIGVISATLSGVLVLIVEYRTGLFLTVPSSHPLAALAAPAFAMVVVATVGSLFFLGRCVWIYMRTYQYVREEFALPVVVTIVLAGIAAVVSVVFQFTPWGMLDLIRLELMRQHAPTPQFTIGDFLVIPIGLTLFVLVLTSKYHAWNGAKSEKEFARESRGQAPDLMADAQSEAQRLWNRQPPFPIHREEEYDLGFETREAAVKSLAWRDQALELLRLSSTNYVIDPITDWHEPPGCWVGTNRANEQVVLYPSQEPPTDNEIKELLKYVDRLERANLPRGFEIIVLTREPAPYSQRKMGGRTIHVESEQSLLEGLLDLTDYREAIRQRVENDTLPGSKLTLRDVYVRPRCQTDDGQQNRDFEELILEWLDDPGQRQLALLGQYGQGKSVAALMLTYKLLQQAMPKRVPILIELRGTSPANNRAELGVLGDWSARYRLSPMVLKYMNDAGRLLLVFEGFDEVANLGEAEMRRRHFARLWGFATPRAKILFTGRGNLFRGKDEMEQALGLRKLAGLSQVLRLSFFDLDQIAEALRNYPAAVNEQVCALARDNQPFNDLVSRPSLLQIVATLWEQAGLAAQINRLNSAYVLDLFVRKSFRRPGRSDDELSLEHPVLTSNERAFFMHGIAAYMVAKKLQNQIDARQLDLAIDELLLAIPNSVSENAPAASGETNEPLLRRLARQSGLGNSRPREPLEISPSVREQVKTDVRTACLLVDDPAAPGTFRFPYKLFMEFLYAVIVADQYKPEASWLRQQARSIIHEDPGGLEDILDETLTAGAQFFGERLIEDELEHIEQQALGRHVDDVTRQHLLADKLLRVVVNRNQPLGQLSRHLILLAALLFKSDWREFASFLSMAIVTIGLLSAGMPYKDNPPSAALIMALALLLESSFLYVGTKRRRLRLWTRLCKRLSVSDQTMHQCIGTYRFLRNKNEPFVFQRVSRSSNK